MSGAEINIECPKCKTVNTLRGKAMTRALTCKSCHVYFCTGSWNSTQIEFMHVEPQALPIGARGRIDDVVYEVMGFVVKRENKYRYTWREYLLFNPYQGYAFLSEYGGHWNFIWPIEQNPKSGHTIDSLRFEDLEYSLYQKYSAEVVYANGEFMFDVYDTTLNTVNYDYISPPYLVTLEQDDDSVLWCKGQYFTPEEVASTFSVDRNALPEKKGVGTTQPFPTPFSNEALITMSALLVMLALALHLFLNWTAMDEQVFASDYDLRETPSQQVLVTRSFDLQGSTKNLEVTLFSPVDNQWFFSEFTLVNETDGTEYNFTKEVEYYHGYEGGESWSEGTRTAEAFLSRIPGGRYHLNIYPDPANPIPVFTIIVTRDVPMQLNFFITCLMLLLFPAFIFIRRRHREQKRWEDSDYSPYATE